MTRKKLIILISALVLTSFVTGSLIGWFYFYFKEGAEAEKVNLIPGVPYNGFYNLYFQQADSTVISSIMDILGYWGDKRFDLADIREKFPPKESFSTLDMKSFFEENGYQTERWTSQLPGGEIERIKRFINPEQKIPVIVFQKCSSSQENPASGFRLIIGIFDQDQKVIVHDHYFGNNYEISFQDFEAMFQSNARAILSVWPSDDLAGIIEGPDNEASYPSRLEEMDKIGNLLVTKGATAVRYFQTDNTEEALPLSEEFINDSDFRYFPPAFQVLILSFLANWHLDFEEQPDEAIKIITERVLPLNHDLDKTPEGWFVPLQDRLATPYFVLARAYLRKGERDLAIQNYEEMKKIEINFNQDIYQSMLEQLEKELE